MHIVKRRALKILQAYLILQKMLPSQNTCDVSMNLCGLNKAWEMFFMLGIPNILLTVFIS